MFSYLPKIFTIVGKAVSRFRSSEYGKYTDLGNKGIGFGLGRHRNEVDPSKLTGFGVVSNSSLSLLLDPSTDCQLDYLQSVWIQQVTWVMSMFLITTTILLFYIKLFPKHWVRKAVYVTGTFMVGWLVYFDAACYYLPVPAGAVFLESEDTRWILLGECQ